MNIVRNILRISSARDRLLKRFAKKLGLIYFGTVDQHTDEHDVIRGLTVSTTHKDTHYAVGSYDGYDMSMVDRFDTIVARDGSKTTHTWMIMRIDLETDVTLPHMFLRPLGHEPEAYSQFFTAYHHLLPINTMLDPSHTPEFHGRYELYATSTHIAEIEEYLTPAVTQVISARLWPHAIELFGNKLYIYTTDTELTEPLLNTALESGLWLARIFDKRQD